MKTATNTRKNLELNLSSSLIGVNLFCTYAGWGQSEIILHEDAIPEDFENGDTDIHPDYYYTYFDNSKYMDEFSKVVHGYIGEKLIDALRYIDVDAEYIEQGYWSPKAYNFHTDQYNFDLTIEDAKPLIDYCTKVNKDKFAQFLRDNYTTRDGFLSFTPNNIAGLLEDLDNPEERVCAYGALISFLLENEGKFTDYYGIDNDLYYSEFVEYGPLDEFLADLDKGLIDENDETLEEWQKAIIERNQN